MFDINLNVLIVHKKKNQKHVVQCIIFRFVCPKPRKFPIEIVNFERFSPFRWPTVRCAVGLLLISWQEKKERRKTRGWGGGRRKKRSSHKKSSALSAHLTIFWVHQKLGGAPRLPGPGLLVVGLGIPCLESKLSYLFYLIFTQDRSAEVQQARYQPLGGASEVGRIVG